MNQIRKKAKAKVEINGAVSTLELLVSTNSTNQHMVINWENQLGITLDAQNGHQLCHTSGVRDETLFKRNFGKSSKKIKVTYPKDEIQMKKWSN